MNLDKIIVFDEGKIVELGTHKQLLKKKGHYYELWKDLFRSFQQFLNSFKNVYRNCSNIIKNQSDNN